MSYFIGSYKFAVPCMAILAILASINMFYTPTWIFQYSSPKQKNQNRPYNYNQTNCTASKHTHVGEFSGKLSRSKQREALNSPLNCAKENQMKRYPDAILIGDKKAGTRAIINFLTLLNPRIRQPLGGEVHFFDVAGTYKHGIEQYLSYMPVSCPGDITIEKSPTYFRTPRVPERIHTWNKDVRLIVSIREPIGRAVSDFYMFRNNLNLPKTFDQVAIKDNGQVNRWYGPIQRSLSCFNIKQWLEYFPLDQILVIDADAFIKENPSDQLNQIEMHLGLQPHITKDMFFYNETKGYYCTTAFPCIQGKGHHRRPLENKTEILLRDYFRPYVRQLRELIQRKLSWMDQYF